MCRAVEIIEIDATQQSGKAWNVAMQSIVNLT